ncbi:MAG TPA: hypothetical protein VK854_05750 [Woeseiaceae bacterium]|nr:hypothetical protein [Woeseiaceae bacterium]
MAAIFEFPIANPHRFSYSGQLQNHTAGARLRQSWCATARKIPHENRSMAGAPRILLTTVRADFNELHAIASVEFT